VHLDPSAFLADPELIQALEKGATPVLCDADRVLFRQGDPSIGLFILNLGKVTLSMDSGSNEPTLNCEASAGSLLGLPGVIANRPYSLTAIALRAAHVSFIARDDFNALMQSNPHLSIMILQVLAAEVRSARLALTQL